MKAAGRKTASFYVLGGLLVLAVLLAWAARDGQAVGVNPGAMQTKEAAPKPDAKEVAELQTLMKARMVAGEKGYETAVQALQQTRKVGEQLLPIGKREEVC